MNMSTTIHPHPDPVLHLPTILISSGKDIIFCPFLVQIYLPFLFQSFPFSFHIFKFTVSLLHFTSPLFTTHHKPYLPSPLSLFIFMVFFFFHPYKPASLLFLPSFPTSTIPSVLQIGGPPLDLAAPSLFPCPLWSLCRPSFSGSVWCVSLWSFCATVHPVDRKHPVHHHSQLPVGSAGSVWPICVIFCQITGAWLHVICPSPNHLPGERGRETGERKVQVGQQALHWLLCLGGCSLVPIPALLCSLEITMDRSCLTKDSGALCLWRDV